MEPARSFPSPSLAAAAAAAALWLLSLGASAALAAWLLAAARPWLAPAGAVALLGLGLAAVPRTVVRLRRLGERLRCRLGLERPLVSVGACRVVHESDGRWALRVDLEDVPGAPARTPTSAYPASTKLSFRLDEGAAGRIARAVDPDERVEIVWYDLSPAAGGPVLRELRRSAESEATKIEDEVFLRAA
jgi:hypothetical protein